MGKNKGMVGGSSSWEVKSIQTEKKLTDWLTDCLKNYLLVFFVVVVVCHFFLHTHTHRENIFFFITTTTSLSLWKKKRKKPCRKLKKKKFFFPSCTKESNADFFFSLFHSQIPYCRCYWFGKCHSEMKNKWKKNGWLLPVMNNEMG